MSYISLETFALVSIMDFFPGLLNSFVDQKIFRKAPWTLKHKEKRQ